MMGIKRFAKLSVLLPAVIGLVTGSVLFWLGSMDDAPGLSLIGLALAFSLIMWGMYNAGVIKRGFLVPTYLFSFGAGGILVSILLLLDGEFEDNPGLALIGVALGIALICFGVILVRKRHGKKQ